MRTKQIKILFASLFFSITAVSMIGAVKQDEMDTSGPRRVVTGKRMRDSFEDCEKRDFEGRGDCEGQETDDSIDQLEQALAKMSLKNTFLTVRGVLNKQKIKLLQRKIQEESE